MKDPEVEGGPRTVFVFEFVTGGGFTNRDLATSWAAEGSAMRRAIAADFAAVPGVRVVMSVDSRLPTEEIPGVEARVIADLDGDWFDPVATSADYTVLIVPESDNFLYGMTREIALIGGRSIGSSAEAVRFVSDKSRLADFFVGQAIPTPPTRAIGFGDPRLPDDWEGPLVVKPKYGAGSVETVLVDDRRRRSWVAPADYAVCQPFLPGQPMSASFLVDVEGRAWLLAVGRQRIKVDRQGRFSYRGGTIPAGPSVAPPAVEAAIRSVVAEPSALGLRGFVGVDFLVDNQGRATVLEINPRPTTSYVGLARLLPPGTIAGAWLDAVEGPLAGTEWPDRLRIDPGTRPLTFDADGTIHARPGDERP